MSTEAQSNACRRARAVARGRSGLRSLRAANSSLCFSCFAATSETKPALFSGERRELTTLTTREASRTWTTPWAYSGAIFTAVWAALVVAPPIRSGTVHPVRLISFATWTISSREGVMRPERPMTSAFFSTAAARIFSHGVRTPRSIDLVVVAGEDDADDVLADVVHVALDGGDHDPALGAGDAAAGDEPALLLLHEGGQVGDGLLHHARGLDDLGKEHLAGAEQVADDAHAVHERALDDVERAGVLRCVRARLLGVLLDEGVDPLDEGVREPLLDRGVRARRGPPWPRSSTPRPARP